MQKGAITRWLSFENNRQVINKTIKFAQPILYNLCRLRLSLTTLLALIHIAATSVDLVKASFSTEALLGVGEVLKDLLKQCLGPVHPSKLQQKTQPQVLHFLGITEQCALS